MMAQSLKARVEQVLAGVANPRMVRDLSVDEQGAVTFTFVLTRDDPAGLARNARKAAQAVAGVTAVKVNVVEADGGAVPARRRPGAPCARAGARGPPHARPPPPRVCHRLPLRTRCRRSARSSRFRAARAGGENTPSPRISPPRARARGTVSACWGPEFASPTLRACSVWT